MSEPTIQPEPDESSAAAGPSAKAPRPRRRWYRKKRYLIPLGLLVVSAVVIGPWPADNSSYVDSDYQRATLERLERSKPLAAEAGPLRVGAAEADITPPVGHPVAGYGSRSDKASTGIRSHCFARAISIARGEATVTVLAADLLIVNRKMADAVRAKTGLGPDEIYFTASHTHSGPGRWGDHPIEELIAGGYSPEFFQSLTDRMAEVVKASRRNMVESEMAVVRLPTERFKRQKNRIDADLPTHDWLYGVFFRRAAGEPGPTSGPDRMLAALAVFGAHATASGLKSAELSADYPGGLSERLREAGGVGVALFAAGAVGDARPKMPPGRDNPDRAHKLGRELADRLIAALPSADWRGDAALASLSLPVDLPTLRVAVSAGWRLSPVCTRWLRDDRTRVHVLTVGPVALVGMPGDYAGLLANRLAEWGDARGRIVVVTSFAGDYVGYIMPRDIFEKYWHYETRTMNFYGPWLGEYLDDLARRMIARLDRAGRT